MFVVGLENLDNVACRGIRGSLASSRSVNELMLFCDCVLMIVLSLDIPML